MVRNFLSQYITAKRRTLLGVGPMSMNSVDVAIELANAHKLPLMLIASRRQIECAQKGGGYVEKWSTEQFVDYVKSRDRGGHVLLARDHGGPWQHPSESKMNLAQAMQSAKESYAADIQSGMQIIHIDPSIDPAGTPSTQALVERVLELYQFCWDLAVREKRDIAFEVGTEEQGVDFNAREFESVLVRIRTGCQRQGLPQPLFIVGQTGTKVMERRNVGDFEAHAKSGKMGILQDILKICARHDTFLKEHNTDYLSDYALSVHPQLGIHAANVAPEFGVVETLAFVELAERTGHQNIAEKFLELAYSSRKWEKWMLPGSEASARERAIVCGHYVFASEPFKDLKAQLSGELKSRKIDLDEHLKDAIRAAMMRYVHHFGMLSSVQSAAS